MDIYQCIGVATVISGTTVFIFLLLSLAAFGGWVSWKVFLEGVDSIRFTFKENELWKINK